MIGGYDYARNDKRDAMAYANMSNSTFTGTTTNTVATTSGSAAGFSWFDGDRMRGDSVFTKDTSHAIRAQTKKMVKDTFKFKRKLVKTLPFKVETGGSLLNSLQREFDHWAGPTKKELFG